MGKRRVDDRVGGIYLSVLEGVWAYLIVCTPV